jgi:hypothetical protein
LYGPSNGGRSLSYPALQLEPSRFHSPENATQLHWVQPVVALHETELTEPIECGEGELLELELLDGELLLLLDELEDDKLDDELDELRLLELAELLDELDFELEDREDWELLLDGFENLSMVGVPVWGVPACGSVDGMRCCHNR